MLQDATLDDIFCIAGTEQKHDNNAKNEFICKKTFNIYLSYI